MSPVIVDPAHATGGGGALMFALHFLPPVLMQVIPQRAAICTILSGKSMPHTLFFPSTRGGMFVVSAPNSLLLYTAASRASLSVGRVCTCLPGCVFQGAACVVACTGTTAFPSQRWNGGNTPDRVDNVAVGNMLRAAAA